MNINCAIPKSTKSLDYVSGEMQCRFHLTNKRYPKRVIKSAKIVLSQTSEQPAHKELAAGSPEQLIGR